MCSLMLRYNHNKINIMCSLMLRYNHNKINIIGKFNVVINIRI